MVERQYEILRRERIRGNDETRSDGPASSDSTPTSTPTPTPATMNEDNATEVN